MNEDLVRFAEQVRRAALEIAGAAGAGRLDLVTQRALALCTMAADVKEGRLMEHEQADLREGTFDLAALRGMVDLGAEAPEREG